MDPQRDTPLAGDLSALAWVQEELRRTLDQAHKSLRRHLREAEARTGGETDGDTPVATALLQARTLVHQGVGALAMIGMPAPARFLNASEQAISRLADRSVPLDSAAIDVIEHASFALLDFLRRELASKPVSPLALFPQYKAVLSLAKVDRVHPADLWEAEGRDEPVASWDSGFAPLEPDPEVHAAIEAAMLQTLRSGSPRSMQRMSDLFAGLSANAQGRTATLWQLATAFFEAQAIGALKADLYTKRLVSRLLAQLRAVERGAVDGPDRLLRDLQFFCGLAQRVSPQQAPRLAQVQHAFGLGREQAVDYERSPLGRYDPAVVPLARRRVASLKETWSALVSGDLALGAAVPEQAALVAESVRQIYPHGNALATALAAATHQANQVPAPGLAMEVATALLCVDASLDEIDLERPEMQQRVQRLAERLATVTAGGEPDPIEPWMESLYREVSDRQTMGSVVQELRASLAEIEQQLDRFNRDPGERGSLMPVPGELAAMRGVLSVLGLDQASQAVQRMRDDIDAVIASSAGAGDVAGRLADNVGGLSFMIDMLGVQPQLAKSLFRFDPDSGRFAAVMGHARAASAAPAVVVEARLVERVQSLADSAAAESMSDADLSRTLDGLSHQAVAADAPELALRAAQARDALESAANESERDAARAEIASGFGALSLDEERPRFSAPAQLQDDEPDDLREIFFEEAREVIGGARDALNELAREPQDLESLTVVRRAFHTLKGSSRMVGLRDYGDAAWACEQLYNARLAEAVVEADAPLRAFSLQALDRLSEWVDALVSGQGAFPDGQALARQAEALRVRSAAPAEEAEPVEPADVLDTVEEEVLPLPDVVSLAELQTSPIALDAPEEVQADPLPQIAELPPIEAVWPEPEPEPEPNLHERPTLQLPGARAPELAPEPEPEESADWASTAEMPLHAALTSVDLELDLEPQGDAPSLADEQAVAEDDADRYKLVGPLRIQIALFNIFLNEADEQSRRLGVEIAEWQHELDRPVSEAAVALAHSLAGNSAAVGYSDLSNLARRMEHGLERSASRGHGQADEAQLFADVGEEIRRLLHQFAAGFLKPVSPELLERLDAHEAREAQEALSGHRSGWIAAPEETESPALAPVAPAPEPPPAPAPESEDFAPATMQAPLGAVRFTSLSDDLAPAELDQPQPATAASREALWGDFAEAVDTHDAIDDELLPIFLDEGRELLPALAQAVRQWEAQPDDTGAATAAMRVLHTLKGSARLAGAMRLGEIAHRLETAIGRVSSPDLAVLNHLHSGVDALAEEFQRLQGGELDLPARVMSAAEVPKVAVVPAAAAPSPSPAKASTGAAVAAPAEGTATGIDWSRFAVHAAAPLPAANEVSGGVVRVRAPLLERLVSHAGEVGIARARIESDMGQLQGSLKELTDNLDRLRRQLRDLELQAETQMTSRMEAARSSQQAFDPLEMDRFTRVQELTRMLAESVGDVGTVQRGIQQTLQSTEDQLAVQARLTRDLQDDLLRARMVEFDTLSDRLYRVVRQASKESGKQVRLNLTGGAIELDRSVLDRMAPAFEHLLRNAVAHGIEPPALREAVGKDPHGQIEISLHQAGNEVRIEVRDDGAGLNLARIADKARAQGLLADDAKPTEGELAGLIFTPGFSTADQVTELAGRGVGMDVVRAEVTSLGGRIETASATGRGTAFQLVLPLTTAVTQVVALACGELHVAVPSTLVETVRRVPVAEVEEAYRHGSLRHGDLELPFFWLGSLLQHGLRGAAEGKTTTVVIARSASQRVALHVSQVLGNQEVVVKNLGPQLARLPGLAGMSLLANGETVLIYNPVALAVIYGDDARRRMSQWQAGVQATAADEIVAGNETDEAIPLNENHAPLVLVVDDSLTVRRVTQRLLQREGYRVTLARDGMDALEQLADERPAVMLSDIEMPRMDGFDLVRNVRNDARLKDLPVIMITSRIAQKHREHAQELGVDHYLGKPYDEEALLALVRSFAHRAVPA
ncbi:MAG: Hpt domain-containing protein [Vitreoscilla sp.]|nr:Hpt domain-containing protein [Vitreoscilla sp.]